MSSLVLQHEENTVINEQVYKPTRSKRRVPKERKWQRKQNRKQAKHPTWINDFDEPENIDPETVLSLSSDAPVNNNHESCGPVPTEPLPTLQSLQLFVLQELATRYGVAVEYVETSVSSPELLHNMTTEVDHNGAFHVTDLGVVVKQALKWKKNLPRVEPFYAVKANPDLNIVRTLFLLGVNFDCASKGEIDLVLGVGAEPSQIIYANPAKGFDHIKAARDRDVRLMTFDNLTELNKIVSAYPDAELVLRIAANDSMSLLPFGFKFGASFKDAVALIHACKEKDVKLIGISFHVGSGCYSPLGFVDTLKRAKELFMEADQIGLHLTLLDIGGGFPGDDEAKITFEEIAAAIGPVIDNLFDDDVHVIAEPGRYFSSACTTTALQVFSKRDYTSRRLGENAGEIVELKEVQYYLPDGVYGAFNNIIYDQATPTVRPLREPPLDAVLYNSTFFGPTCDSIDVIAKHVHFPELDIGEWVYCANMGAYTVAAGSRFNGFEKPIIHYKMIKNGFTNTYL